MSLEQVENYARIFYADPKRSRSLRHDVEDAIHDYLKHEIRMDSKRQRAIEDRMHDVMKHENHTFDEMWEIYTGLVDDTNEKMKEQIMECIEIFYDSNLDSDRYVVQDLFDDYLKKVINLDDRLGESHTRHRLTKDVRGYLKYGKLYGNLNCVNACESIDRIINFAEKIEPNTDITEFENMSSDDLRTLFVPKVYQKDVFDIEWERLKYAGIKVISFDVDDTLGWAGMWTPPSEIEELVANLKNMGFQIVLLSNGWPIRVKKLGDKLGAFLAIGHAEKPYTYNFEYIQMMYEQVFGETLENNEMAHVGNDIMKDVRTGNTFGLNTCLVRNVGRLPCFCRMFYREGHELRDLLKSRKIWRKHHFWRKDDQYYQLGESQKL